MCISLPAKVLSVGGDQAEVESGGSVRRVLLTVEGTKAGDWVLIYAGAALQRLSEDEAREINELLGILAVSPK